MASLSDAEQTLRSTNAKANFQRLTRLLICGGAKLLREKFDCIHKPADLPKKLSEAATIKQLKGAHLTKDEWKYLYPCTGTYGKSSDFDITLTFRLFRHICSLTPPPSAGPPGSGWDKLPIASDHSLEADLARIKYYRNKVHAHTTTMEIPDDEFGILWKEISEALLRIAASISHVKRDEWKKSIDKFMSDDPLTPEAERFVDELQLWYEKDRDVKKEIQKLCEEFRSLREKVRQSSDIVGIPVRIVHSVETMELKGKRVIIIQVDHDVQEQAAGMESGLSHDQRTEENRQELPKEKDFWDVVANYTDFFSYLEYLEDKCNVILQYLETGSLLVTVKCSSLQILEELWENYDSGHLNEVAQKIFVTDDVLEKLGLTGVKLKTNISEEEYKKGKQILVDKLACPVCLEQFSEIREPKKLRCLHTFCKACLEAWLQAQREEKLSCPMCRQITKCPNNNINNIPSSFPEEANVDDIEDGQDAVADGGGNESESGHADQNRTVEPPVKSEANVDDIEDGQDGQDAVADGGGNESESGHANQNRTVELPVMSEDESQVLAKASFRSDAVNNEALLFSALDSGRSGQLRSFTGITTHKSSGGTNHGSSLMGRGPAPTPAATHAAAIYSQAPLWHGQQSRLQHDSAAGPPPVRYVNDLAYQGYSVEIIGGKHFKTPEGEFVEMKSGTQYQIHVKNSRAYGCNLDISIDGYDVGGWVVDGDQELTIETPAYEAKKFTFYRVKTAPKEAGIESGRSENGVVKCVFTPEAFLNIPVVIPGLPQPMEVNMAPNATVGDLKREVQNQLKATEDLDQILVLNDKVLSNFTRLSNVVISPGNLRLIDVQLEITIKTSSNELFTVKIHPGQAKVLDLMDQIQRKLDVPIKDQKLYHGRSRLSDEPRRGLSQELICSFQPTVVVIVPEYILVTVEDLISGDSSIVKIDKEKTLKDLVEEIPSCRNLPENKEAMFYYNEKELCPSRDDETLTKLGIFSGSKLELKVKIIYIEINVARYPGSLPTLSIDIRCNPQDTFKDLLNKLEARCNTGKLEGATFTTGERVFDPEQDQSPLQDYGIKHGSALVMKLAESQSNVEELHAQGIENVPQYQAAGEEGQGKIIWYEGPHLGESKHDDDNSDLISQGRVIEECREQIHYQSKKVSGTPGLKAQSGKAGRRRQKSHLYESQGRVQIGEAELQAHGGERASASSCESGFPTAQVESHARILNANDPAWKAGGTKLQGHSTQQFMAADPIKVDHSKKIELVLRLVAREDDEFHPLSTPYPPAVPE